MKRALILGTVLVFGFSIIVSGCGDQGGGGSSGEHNPAVSASELFDVSGATAIAAASALTASTSAIRASSTSTVTELLKLTASDEISSILSEYLSSTWHPPISVIETGPDGSLYIGFDWGIWIRTDDGSEMSAAFFKIARDGTVEIVDSDIHGVGTWYGHSENGELPVKQVQFDSEGNIYYLAKTSGGNPILKKKTVGGTISQIGNNKMAVRDFLVCDDGMVLFHGSNSDSWSIEWLRVIKNGAVNNIFYNSGSGWLRAYYIDNSNNVFLVGENLMLLDEDEVPQKYSGIIKVSLSDTGAPTAVTCLYDDDNMYSEDHHTIGSQLTWGYWDPVDMVNKRFFAYDDYGEIILPLSLEAGVTEASIRSFIRRKYQDIDTDTLDSVTFSGVTTTDAWRINNVLDDLIAANISGTTWATWRANNDLTGVKFGNAKQLVFADSGALFAVISLDNWGSGSSRGDKLFQIVDADGNPEIIGFPQDTANYYKSMSKVRAYGDYAVYLSNKVGKYKILRLDLTNPTAGPVDMIPDKTNIEIFSFSYNSGTGMLFFDVYDLGTNTSYLAEQDITSTSMASEISASGYTITDVVPFSATH